MNTSTGFTSTRLTLGWVLAGLGAVAVTSVLSVSTGPVSLNPVDVFVELADHLPLVSWDSGLDRTGRAIVWDIRAPRVVLGLLVGGLLSGSGAAYQGVFRNPLADPYLLGVAAGAGLGVTIAVVAGIGDGVGQFDPVPMAAFLGALGAVLIAGVLGSKVGAAGSTTTLILAGVAVASFLTAIQTYVQQRNSDTLRQVYVWILGRLSQGGWGEVLLVLPYAIVSLAVIWWFAGALDVLAVGDDEAATLGLEPAKVRFIVLVFASLGAAAAVSVSGLIGFVGLIVPHGVRSIAGVSNRLVVPLSILFGAAFLALADIVARTAQSPAELPIGVVTAFVGAPFFLMILRSQSGRAT